MLLAEVLAALTPKAGGCYADGTIGAGGHAAAILEASEPSGRLYGCDRDSSAVKTATERLARFAGSFELRVGSFAELADWLGPCRCDGVLLDLGISSVQLGQPERGFSFQSDGSLDMRMDRRQPMTAADLLNHAATEELARVFREFGEEPMAARIAGMIAQERTHQRFTSTRQLASLIERNVPRKTHRIHPATRVFQALRIAVNDELGHLRRGLRSAWTTLKPGGRLAVITFHSLEDRIVKEFGRRMMRDYDFDGPVDVPELRRPKSPESKWVYRKAITPSAGETAENPRARSAQLRVMERL